MANEDEFYIGCLNLLLMVLVLLLVLLHTR